MFIVKLMGGLGNQMFEYAFGQALSSDVMYDTAWFEDVKNIQGATPRVYELKHFNLKAAIAPQESVEAMKLIKKSKLPSFIRKISAIPKYKTDVVTENPVNVYREEYVKCKKGYFDGYFQSEKYFKHLRERLLLDFSLREPMDDANQQMLEKIKQQKDSVSLHVRRGDYMNLAAVHLPCGLDYYQKAVDYVCRNVKNPHFFLFSDDIDWVKENLKINYPCIPVDINTPDKGYYDLELMKNCHHNIIANSSFSWWGAWLNAHPDKVVVAPLRWHKDNQNREWDIFPDEWVVL